MEKEIKSAVEGQKQVEIPGEGPSKSKGGRPNGKDKYRNCKLTLYLSEDEYKRFAEFTKNGWSDYNYSRAARFLLLHTLEDWELKGKKRVGLFREYK